MACEISLVVPNIKLSQLEFFFKKNWRVLAPALGRRLQLIIVSSALDVAKLKAFKNRYPKVQFVNIEKNHGFATTVNTGFCLANGIWLGTVNDDVILNKNWWLECLKVTDCQTGSINPVILDLHGKVESAGIKILPIGKAEPLKRVLKIPSAVVDATNGACVLYRREALKTVGFFDPCFGSYLEDVDLSLRLKRCGWKNLVCFKAQVIHLGHASSSAKKNWYKAWLDCKNWWLVILKNWSIKTWLKYWPLILLERLRNLSGLFKQFFIF